MRTVFDNPMVAHVWAQQNQQSGRGSHFYFEGATIYSYGRHFPIARFVSNRNGERAVLFNCNGYEPQYIEKQLTSSGMFHTLGFFRALQNDYRIKGEPRKKAISILSEGYRLPLEEAEGLLSDRPTSDTCGSGSPAIGAGSAHGNCARLRRISARPLLSPRLKCQSQPYRGSCEFV